MFSQSETEGDFSSGRASSGRSGRAGAILYTPQEIAERCGLSRRRVYDWLSWGWLRGRRHGGRWLVTADDWEFFARICRGARGRLMPSLRDWGPIWQAQPTGEAGGAASQSPGDPNRRG